VTVTGAAHDARTALLGRLIDHAPLFPPASMTVPDAAAEDRRARESPYAWMLDRFVCPASKLAAMGREMPWDTAPGLSVVLETDDLAELRRAADSGAPIEAIELRLTEPLPSHASLAELRSRVEWTPYFELLLGEPWRDTVPDAVAAVAEAGGRVKLRCGGDTVPSVEQVALVIVACRDAGCVFKATAGLHHPIRRGTQHGFLNLLAAVTFAHAQGAGPPELEPVLAEENPRAVSVAENGIAVHERHADRAEIAAAREGLFASIGSCSWREPVEDLQALDIL
jgi:hypothetical protein